MNEHIEILKTKMDLSRLESEFLDFCVMSLGINRDSRPGQIQLQIQPWFGGVTPEGKIYTQVYSEYVHQKYRIALEFCAQQSGYQPVSFEKIGADIVAVSTGMFWLRGMHPQPVDWIMTENDKIIARGQETAHSINRETLETWLLNTIHQISSSKKSIHSKPAI